MRREGKISIILMLAVFLFFALVKSGMSVKPDKTTGIDGEPVWQITQDGTAESIEWVDHEPNPRFAIYDPGTPEDETDDVVLDKETGLVWERDAYSENTNWFEANVYCYLKNLGGRKGWRLPAVEELATLIDETQDSPKLPSGHPFVLVPSGGDETSLWTATTVAGVPDNGWRVHFDSGELRHAAKTAEYKAWCVRGGCGHDAY